MEEGHVYRHGGAQVFPMQAGPLTSTGMQHLFRRCSQSDTRGVCVWLQQHTVCDQGHAPTPAMHPHPHRCQIVSSILVCEIAVPQLTSMGLPPQGCGKPRPSMDIRFSTPCVNEVLGWPYIQFTCTIFLNIYQNHII